MPELTDQNGKKLNVSFGRPTDNVPHDVEIEHVQATELAVGVQLQTKDGARMGNAIIMKSIKGTTPGMRAWLEKNDLKLWLVQTDFGNVMCLTESEILELFDIGWVSNYDRWFDARLELIRKTVKDHG